MSESDLQLQLTQVTERLKNLEERFSAFQIFFEDQCHDEGIYTKYFTMDRVKENFKKWEFKIDSLEPDYQRCPFPGLLRKKAVYRKIYVQGDSDIQLVSKLEYYDQLCEMEIDLLEQKYSEEFEGSKLPDYSPMVTAIVLNRFSSSSDDFPLAKMQEVD